jgi:hypothetical protein
VTSFMMRLEWDARQCVLPNGYHPLASHFAL